MTSIVSIAIIAVAVFFIAAALVDVVRTVRKSRKESSEPLRDPAECDHEWILFESATCMPSYSSCSGPDPQETWRVERCPHCGTQQFSCTGTCDCYAGCAATHEQKASA